MPESNKQQILAKLNEAIELAKLLPDDPDIPESESEIDNWWGKYPGPDPLPRGEPKIKETIRPVGDPVWIIRDSGHYDLDRDINSPHRSAIVVGAPDVHIHGNGHVVQSAGAPNPRNVQCAVNVVHLYSSNMNPDDEDAGLTGLKRAHNCTISDLTIRARSADTRFFQAVGGYSVTGTIIKDCLLEGRGEDGRAFGLRFGGLIASRCTFISRMHATVNRHQSPACIQAERAVLDQCVVYGGSSGIYIKGDKGGLSEITRSVIANVGIDSNAYGIQRGAKVSAKDNIFLAVHGLGARGVLVQDKAESNVHEDNVFLSWNRGNAEFNQQYASALRWRYGAKGIQFNRNHVLCLGGGPEGSDSDFRFAIPIRSTLTSDAGENHITQNYLGAVHTSPPGELMHLQGLKGAACIGHHDKGFPQFGQVIEGNFLESNDYVMSLAGWEGTSHQNGEHRNNEVLTFRTPQDMIDDFRDKRDVKLDDIGMGGNEWAQWIVLENDRILLNYLAHCQNKINSPIFFHTGACEGDETITVLGSGEITLADCQPRNVNSNGKRRLVVGEREPERWFGRDTNTGPYAENEV